MGADCLVFLEADAFLVAGDTPWWKYIFAIASNFSRFNVASVKWKKETETIHSTLHRACYM